MTNKIFQHKITVPFQDIDAAGIVFFAHLFRYAHETYEQFMSDIGLSLARILQEREYLLPLIHAEADYLIPLQHGDSIRISLSVEKIGNSSFTLVYIFEDEKGRERAVTRTLHVVINAQDKKKVCIPAELNLALKNYTSANK